MYIYMKKLWRLDEDSCKNLTLISPLIVAGAKVTNYSHRQFSFAVRLFHLHNLHLYWVQRVFFTVLVTFSTLFLKNFIKANPWALCRTTGLSNIFAGLSWRAVSHNTCYSRQASLMSLWCCRWTCLFLVQFTHRVCYGCEDQGLKTFDRPVLELAVILSYCSPVVIFKGSHFWVGSYFWRDPYLLGSIGKYLTNVTFRELLLRWTIIFMVCRKTSWCHQ